MALTRYVLPVCLCASLLAAGGCARSGPPAPVDVHGVGSGETYPGQQGYSGRYGAGGGGSSSSSVEPGYTPPAGYGGSSSGITTTPLSEVNDAYSQQAVTPGKPAVTPPLSGGLSSAPASTPFQSTPSVSATAPMAAPTVPPVSGATASGVASAVDSSVQGTGPFGWPLRGSVITEFGPQPAGQKNDGLNISAPLGTPVYAAKEGTVSYVGNELKGFGTMILLKHEGGMFSVYAHLSSASVTKGQTITKGQAIGAVGQTGQVSEPQLHFEIRRGSTPLDPRKYLSK